MASLNQATIIGYLAQDPTVRMTQSGRKVASVSIGTTEKGYTAKDGTVYPDRTEWHNVTLWGRLAEVCEKYLRKGAQVYVQGMLRTRAYEDKDKVKRYTTEIEAMNLLMLDRKPADASAPQPAQQVPPAPQAQYYQGSDPAYGLPPQPPLNADDGMPF